MRYPADRALTNIQRKYARAARSVIDTGSTGILDGADFGVFGQSLYDDHETSVLPAGAAAASLGCGNPVAVVELREGETVLDLGSGGGLDVLLSARRVGPTGRAIGLDMTQDMLDLARHNAAEAGVTNVEFLAGHIERIPLPGASVDVVTSNCVITLSSDKAAVFREMARVLRPGGRIGLSDVLADDSLTDDERRSGAGDAANLCTSLTKKEYVEALTAVGLVDVEVRYTHDAGPKLHAALIRASKPGGAGCHRPAFESRDAADAVRGRGRYEPS